jgi:hypothetical protein
LSPPARSCKILTAHGAPRCDICCSWIEACIAYERGFRHGRYFRTCSALCSLHVTGASDAFALTLVATCMTLSEVRSHDGWRLIHCPWTIIDIWDLIFRYILYFSACRLRTRPPRHLSPRTSNRTRDPFSHYTTQDHRLQVAHTTNHSRTYIANMARAKNVELSRNARKILRRRRRCCETWRWRQQRQV